MFILLHADIKCTYDDTNNDSHYAVLGVVQSATHREICASYRNLAKSMHPDKRINQACAHDDFIKIRAAYDILSNEKKRMEYDKTLSHTPMCSFLPQFVYDVFTFYMQ